MVCCEKANEEMNILNWIKFSIKRIVLSLALLLLLVVIASLIKSPVQA